MFREPMSDPLHESLPQIIARLSATPLSQNVARLLRGTDWAWHPTAVSLLDSTKLVQIQPLQSLAVKAMGDGYLTCEWAYLAAKALELDPNGMYDLLTSPHMQTADTLEALEELFLANLADMYEDRSIPRLSY